MHKDLESGEDLVCTGFKLGPDSSLPPVILGTPL